MKWALTHHMYPSPMKHINLPSGVTAGQRLTHVRYLTVDAAPKRPRPAVLGSSWSLQPPLDGRLDVSDIGEEIRITVRSGLPGKKAGRDNSRLSAEPIGAGFTGCGFWKR